jgi:hypothetical protein
MDIRMAVLFSAVETGTTGKNNIGDLKQTCFTLHQLCGSVEEARELVHAVVYDGPRLHLFQQR